jgi:hypothetical protein
MANGVEDLELSEYTAKEITHGDFQAIKRSFGTGLLPQITELAMPGFPDAKVHISWYVDVLLCAFRGFKKL